MNITNHQISQLLAFKQKQYDILDKARSGQLNFNNTYISDISDNIKLVYIIMKQNKKEIRKYINNFDTPQLEELPKFIMKILNENGIFA